MRAFVCMIGLALASSPGMAAAQSLRDCSALHAKIGDKVYVTDLATGVEVYGQLTASTATRLEVDRRVFVPAPGLKIEKPATRVRTAHSAGREWACCSGS